VSRARIRRMGAIVVASLFATQLFASAASAAPPRWEMTVERLPSIVKNLTDAGFQITITNEGPSNIAQLYLVDSPTATPVYLATSQGDCGTSDLLCSFGALNAGDEIVVTVAYATQATGSSFAYTAQLNATGVSFDKGGNSHGDSLSRSVTTTLTSDKNFGGGFLSTPGGVANDTKLHPGKNKQSTQLFGIAGGIPATVEDGPGLTFPCPGCAPAQTEWSRIQVNSGQAFTQPFKVVITAVGSFNNLDLETVVVYHVLDSGALVLIGNTADEHCDSPTDPGVVPLQGCVFAALVGNNLQLTVYVYQNGAMRK
jgi:hypothetical protein